MQRDTLTHAFGQWAFLCPLLGREPLHSSPAVIPPLYNVLLSSVVACCDVEHWSLSFFLLTVYSYLLPNHSLCTSHLILPLVVAILSSDKLLKKTHFHFGEKLCNTCVSVCDLLLLVLLELDAAEYFLVEGVCDLSDSWIHSIISW